MEVLSKQHHPGHEHLRQAFQSGTTPFLPGRPRGRPASPRRWTLPAARTHGWAVGASSPSDGRTLGEAVTAPPSVPAVLGVAGHCGEPGPEPEVRPPGPSVRPSSLPPFLREARSRDHRPHPPTAAPPHTAPPPRTPPTAEKARHGARDTHRPLSRCPPFERALRLLIGSWKPRSDWLLGVAC